MFLPRKARSVLQIASGLVAIRTPQCFLPPRVLLLAVFVVSWMLCCLGVASAQTWTSHGPEGGFVSALAVDPVTPTTVYAGTYSTGVFKSTDAGNNWSAANTGLTYLYINLLAIDPTTPTTVYAGTDLGLFKSINGGGNWSEANTGLDLIRFGGHLPKGGYDVRNGRDTQPTAPSAIHG